MIEALFGTGPAAGWVVLLYFLAGGGGSLGRVWLSSTIPNRGPRTIVETVSGGAYGIVLSYIGSTWLPEAVWTFPPIFRAAFIFLITGGSSLLVGDVLARIRGGVK